ncbi:MAG: carboxymuconolactone decarboxylase family protein [Planctomycetota bacterium]|nr:carboxymuconolactone decarboxylase family protein [Planctomycetota bacterium]
MPRLATVDPTTSPAFAGGIPQINIFKGIAHSPEILKGILGLMSSVKTSKALTAQEIEVVALTTAEFMHCEYCVAAHTKLATASGFAAEHVKSIRRGNGADTREQALIDFTKRMVETKGYLTDGELAAFRTAGFNDAAAIAVMAEATAMTFTAYYNHIHQTEIDFPAAPSLEEEKICCGGMKCGS